MAIVVNAKTNRIYVASANGSIISVIEGEANEVIATVAVSPNPIALVVNRRNNLVYVGYYNSNEVSTIDGRSNAVIGSTFFGSVAPASLR
jgi:YVTN family beta-propeller protein